MRIKWTKKEKKALRLAATDYGIPGDLPLKEIKKTVWAQNWLLQHRGQELIRALKRLTWKLLHRLPQANFIWGFDNQKVCLDLARVNAEINKIPLLTLLVTLGDEKERYNLAALIIDGVPDVYKMDIEGAEFKVLPLELEKLRSVHTWIIEIHPQDGSPGEIIRLFDGELWNSLIVDRDSLTIRPIQPKDHDVDNWKTHQTVIFQKRDL